MSKRGAEHELCGWPSIQGQGDLLRLAFEDAARVTSPP